jgi:transcriptional regulator
MYIPSANKIEDPKLIVELMRQNPFATLVSTAGDVPVATHLPILLDSEEPIVLCGHLARQNQQWKSWAPGARVLVIFAGPHGYVSPRYYESRPNVPTWNYVSVHAYGRIDLIEDSGQALAHLERMVAAFDPNLADVLPESMDRDFLLKLLPGIVVFRITIERIDAKAKLSQNKSQADQFGVQREHGSSQNSDERKLAKMMSVEAPS